MRPVRWHPCEARRLRRETNTSADSAQYASNRGSKRCTCPVVQPPPPSWVVAAPGVGAGVGVGAGAALVTDNVKGEEIVVLPEVSRAIAVKLCVPLATAVLSQAKE